MKKRALLINPPTGLFIREDRCQVPVKNLITVASRPPIDLAYIGAILLKNGLDCRIKDYPVEGGDWNRVTKDISEFVPDYLVISVTSFTLKKDIRAADIAKKVNPKIIVIAKGAHFNEVENAEKTLKDFVNLNIIVRGEYEITFEEIVKGKELSVIEGVSYRNGEVIKNNPDRKFAENLDTFPFPARELMKNNLYVRPDTKEPQTTIQTGRGCPAKCIFCVVPKTTGGRLRGRSPKNVVNEIQECVEKFSINNFFFRADTFTWSKKWVIEVCEEILERDLNIKWVCNSRVDTVDKERLRLMKAAGCWAISFGAESGNQEILNILKKGITLRDIRNAVELCREFGITAILYFFFGTPWETKKTALQTIEFAKEVDPDFVEFYVAIPFPGTELAQIIAEEGLLVDLGLDGFDYTKPAVKTLSLSREEISSLRKKAIKSFYLRPGFIYKKFRQTKSPRILLSYLHYGIKMIINILKKNELAT